MTSRDFCYWLQGYFEIHGNRPIRAPESVYNLNDSQVDMIRKHLAMVFIHEIDPSMGPKLHRKLVAHTFSRDNRGRFTCGSI